MADGYARASGAPGVVVATTGPGATNTLTPLVESYAGSMPVLVVMSDIASHLVGRDVGALHEVPNQIECFKPVTRWAEAVTESAAIPATVHGAFDLLRTGRPGPIAISIPNDFLTARFETSPRSGGHGRRPPCHVDEIREAASRVGGAPKPLVSAGGGVIAAGAEGELSLLARRLGAPVITSVMGRGAISERDPLWHGVLPNSRATEAVIKAADVILAVGCRFAHRSTQGLLLNLSFDPSQTLIHLDLDPTVIGRLFKPQLPIVGDAKDGLTRILQELGSGTAQTAWDHPWRQGLRSAANSRYTAQIAGLIDTLRAALPGPAAANLPLSRGLGDAGLRCARGDRRQDRPARPSGTLRRRRRRPHVLGQRAGDGGEIPAARRVPRHERRPLRRDQVAPADALRGALGRSGPGEPRLSRARQSVRGEGRTRGRRGLAGLCDQDGAHRRRPDRPRAADDDRSPLGALTPGI